MILVPQLAPFYLFTGLSCVISISILKQDSMGKDGTQLLRHCVRLLVLVSTDLLAVRSSGIRNAITI